MAIVVAAADAALANGVQVKDIVEVPDGYPVLLAVGFEGAGIESAQLDYSNGELSDHIPLGPEIAIETRVLPVGMIPVNKVLPVGTRIHITPYCTGTAEGIWFFEFGRQQNGPTQRWQKDTVDTSSVTAGTTVIEVPEHLNIAGASPRVLADIFIRGPDISYIELSFGKGGRATALQGRHVALNADAEEIKLTPVGEPVRGLQKLVYTGIKNTGTGGATNFYSRFTA